MISAIHACFVISNFRTRQVEGNAYRSLLSDWPEESQEASGAIRVWEGVILLARFLCGAWLNTISVWEKLRKRPLTLPIQFVCGKSTTAVFPFQGWNFQGAARRRLSFFLKYGNAACTPSSTFLPPPFFPFFRHLRQIHHWIPRRLSATQTYHFPLFRLLTSSKIPEIAAKKRLLMIMRKSIGTWPVVQWWGIRYHSCYYQLLIW